MKQPRITIRDVPPRAAWALEQAGVHPLLARLLAARGVADRDDTDDALARLLAPDTLLGCAAAAKRLADAVQQRERVCIVADYDCDGATACALALRGLSALGAAPGTLQYVVPDRIVHGYGLQPSIVDLASLKEPRLLVTVDNGIASLDGVAHARARALDVIVTDHHLPALGPDGRALLPDGAIVVNPNQPDCRFASKCIAGVGVMFYVLLAVRAELRARGAFGDPPAANADGASARQPRLDALLDLVALGTVADVVKLDANNRRLVAQGLKRMRAGRMQPGLAALFAVAGRDPACASTGDLGFAIGPRLNAAGRLADMTIGIECLLADDEAQASELARMLDAINAERRDIEAGMRAQAEALLDARLQAQSSQAQAAPAAIALFDDGFHEGVVGIVASRLKEQAHRPAFVFARGHDGLLKGSGRSIAAFHLRDALDLVAKRHPGLLKRFGGHAMAAGCTLAEADFTVFDEALQQVAAEWLDDAQLERVLPTDGSLAPRWFDADTVRLLDAQVWGQAFDAPRFCDWFEVTEQRLVGERHLKLRLRHDGVPREAIWFHRALPVADRVRLAYRLALDEYQGAVRVQLVVEAALDDGTAASGCTDGE